jgi:asparaginyl-tRNA synthetase
MTGQTFSGLQIIADRDLPNYQSEILKLQTGCSVTADGTLAASPGKGQTVELEGRYH